jgi:hypothetical protein
MEAKNLNWSRRKVFTVAAGGVSASFLLRAEIARAQEKMSLAQAQYRNKPNGIYSCGNCSLFEKPHGCKVVAGEVTEDGWCKAYSPVD